MFNHADVVYPLQNCADLHKFFVRFSHLKSFLLVEFSTNTKVY